MEREGGVMVKEVIYEICKHAEGVFSPELFEQESSPSRSGLLTYFSIQGAKKLKQKWDEYRRPRGPKRKLALFVSPGGEHVAVAFQNQLVILQKSDNYMEPCGTYIGNDRLSCFTNGAWMEPQGILGVIDDLSNLYFINTNGREIARWTRRDLKLTSYIIDLIVMDYACSIDTYIWFGAFF